MLPFIVIINIGQSIYEGSFIVFCCLSFDFFFCFLVIFVLIFRYDYSGYGASTGKVCQNASPLVKCLIDLSPITQFSLQMLPRNLFLGCWNVLYLSHSHIV